MKAHRIVPGTQQSRNGGAGSFCHCHLWLLFFNFFCRFFFLFHIIVCLNLGPFSFYPMQIVGDILGKSFVIQLLMIWKCVFSSSKWSADLQSHTHSCLLDISTWMFYVHFKVTSSSTSPSPISSHLYVPMSGTIIHLPLKSGSLRAAHQSHQSQLLMSPSSSPFLPSEFRPLSPFALITFSHFRVILLDCFLPCKVLPRCIL